MGAGWAGGGRVGWYGPVGRNVCTARKGIRVCGVKNTLRTAGDRKSWRKMEEGVRENTHELKKNAKILEKINTIISRFKSTKQDSMLSTKQNNMSRRSFSPVCEKGVCKDLH